MSKNVNTSGRVYIKEGALYCSEHKKLLGRISEAGIELWCKGQGGHPVIMDFEELRPYIKGR